MLTPHVSVEQVSFWAAAEMATRRAIDDLSTAVIQPITEEKQALVNLRNQTQKGAEHRSGLAIGPRGSFDSGLIGGPPSEIKFYLWCLLSFWVFLRPASSVCVFCRQDVGKGESNGGRYIVPHSGIGTEKAEFRHNVDPDS